jgi:hypothetical protein
MMALDGAMTKAANHGVARASHRTRPWRVEQCRQTCVARRAKSLRACFLLRLSLGLRVPSPSGAHPLVLAGYSLRAFMVRLSRGRAVAHVVAR